MTRVGSFVSPKRMVPRTCWKYEIKFSVECIVEMNWTRAIFYMDVIGLCGSKLAESNKSKHNMRSFFTDLLYNSKVSRHELLSIMTTLLSNMPSLQVAIPSMVEVRHMIPSSYTFKHSDGTSVDIDLTPFRSCGYAKKSNPSSDQPSPHKLDSGPAQSQSSVQSPSTLESHVESDSHKSDAPPHKRPTLPWGT